MQGKNKDGGGGGAPPPTEFSAEERATQSRALRADGVHSSHAPETCPYAADDWAADGRWADMFDGPLTHKVLKQAKRALLKAGRCTWRAPIDRAEETRQRMARVLGTGPAAGTVGELVKQVKEAV